MLAPIEVEILVAAMKLLSEGEDTFHGFGIAKRVQEQTGARKLLSHGSLYEALARMEEAGLLQSRWESARQALAEHRPRRRLYRVTPAGHGALARATLVRQVRIRGMVPQSQPS